MASNCGLVFVRFVCIIPIVTLLTCCEQTSINADWVKREMKKNIQPDFHAVCQRIRDEMAAKEPPWKNLDLAREAKLSPRLITNIRKGTATLRDRTIASIATALGVRYQWLARGEEPRLTVVAVTRMGPAREPVVREKAAEYHTRADSDLPPLHRVIAMLAIHLDISESDIMEFVLEKMKGKKP